MLIIHRNQDLVKMMSYSDRYWTIAFEFFVLVSEGYIFRGDLLFKHSKRIESKLQLKHLPQNAGHNAWRILKWL